MTDERQKVLELVAAGKVSPEEANALLKAMEKPHRPLWGWLFKPMERLGTSQALVLSLAVVLVGAALSHFHVRFPGALDVKGAHGAVPPQQALLDVALSWLLPAGVFWLVSLVVARQGRFVDFLTAVGVARIPLVLSGVALAAMGERLEKPPLPVDPVILMVSFLVLLPCVAWAITLFVTGFRTASGLRGGRLAAAFIAALVAAEALSLFVLWMF